MHYVQAAASVASSSSSAAVNFFESVPLAAWRGLQGASVLRQLVLNNLVARLEQEPLDVDLILSCSMPGSERDKAALQVGCTKSASHLPACDLLPVLAAPLHPLGPGAPRR